MTSTRITRHPVPPSAVSALECDRRLFQNESLRVWAVALHPAKPGQPQKRLLVEPVVARLRRVVLEQQARLLLGHLGFERMIDRRARSVGLPFENLVAEQEMVTKLGRQQFGKQPMILMSVAALRTEHHIWGARSAESRSGDP